MLVIMCVLKIGSVFKVAFPSLVDDNVLVAGPEVDAGYRQPLHLRLAEVAPCGEDLRHAAPVVGLARDEHLVEGQEGGRQRGRHAHDQVEAQLRREGQLTFDVLIGTPEGL